VSEIRKPQRAVGPAEHLGLVQVELVREQRPEGRFGQRRVIRGCGDIVGVPWSRGLAAANRRHRPPSSASPKVPRLPWSSPGPPVAAPAGMLLLRTIHLAAGLLALASTPGCLGPDPDAPEETSASIIGGFPDPSDAAVVALTYLGQQFCTGTVVSARTVITAGHCLRTTGIAPRDIRAYFGRTVGGSGESLACTAGAAHPSWHIDDSGAPIHDVAYLTLAGDAPVAPVTWQSTELPDVVGHSVQMVGYGVTDARRQTGNGTRRTVNETITGQDGRFLYYGDGRTGTCQGDSGGPTFLPSDGGPTLIAVTSYGDSSCVQAGANTRVDTYASFLSQHTTAGASPRPQPDERNEDEPNNSRSRARVIRGAEAILGKIDPVSDVDYFKASIPSGATLSVDLVAPPDADYGLRLSNGSGELMTMVDTAAGIGASLAWRNASSGARVIYLEVHGIGGCHSASEPYHLQVSW
jgi:V8-like Glu-specific endopeptidase